MMSPASSARATILLYDQSGSFGLTGQVLTSDGVYGTSWVTPTPLNVFISPVTPSNPPSQYLWIQTGLGAAGTDFTFWFQDGT